MIRAYGPPLEGGWAKWPASFLKAVEAARIGEELCEKEMQERRFSTIVSLLSEIRDLLRRPEWEPGD